MQQKIVIQQAKRLDIVEGSMSHFAEYIKETLGKSIVENEHGFATFYFLDNGDCYIEDVYVVPSQRKNNIGSQFGKQIEEIAKGQGSKNLIGSVNLLNKTANESLKVLLAYGFKLDSLLGNHGIVFKKEL